MINADMFVKVLLDNDLKRFIGVPDSLLKEFAKSLACHRDELRHTITPSEGTAVALAIGYQLATNKTPVVYMQNSGLGNALNPLISLAHENVYGIPMVLVIGWRGAPLSQDEPQHLTQGAVTRQILELIGIDYLIIDHETKLEKIRDHISKVEPGLSGPTAILISPGIFDETEPLNVLVSPLKLSREQAVKLIVITLSQSSIVVATTGKISRELNEYRDQNKCAGKDFLTVGGMGHSSIIALGIAEEFPNRVVVSLDGDGAFQMHLGASALIGERSPPNFVHVIFNNGVHESVGGQQIAAQHIKYNYLAKAFGYKKFFTISSEEEIRNLFPKLNADNGPFLIEIKVNLEVRRNLSRPKASPLQNKLKFQSHLIRLPKG